MSVLSGSQSRGLSVKSQLGLKRKFRSTTQQQRPLSTHSVILRSRLKISDDELTI